MQIIVPMLTYEDGPAAMDWLCRAFGFQERARMLDGSGRLTHGELMFNGGRILVAAPSPLYQNPRSRRAHDVAERRLAELPWVMDGVLVYVTDVDAHCATAQFAGAIILTPPSEAGVGRLYRAEDPEGHRWMFLQGEPPI